MVLMAIDHASVMFNAGRVDADTAARWVSGTTLPWDQFFTRWITHLCAPTFLFLAGAGIALGSAARLARDPDAGPSVDKDLLIRGTLIILFDVVYLSAIAPGSLLLQVLYAIGLSMVLMVPLRRLGPYTLAGLGVGWFAVGEWITGMFWHPPTPPSWPVRLTLAPYFSDEVNVIYPVVPWLAMMMLGWAFGAWLAGRREANAPPPIGPLLGAGAACLAGFAVIRGLNGYGNMFLPRDDGSLVQWLHVSKYPPSAAFASLELGLLFVVLAGLMWAEPRVRVRKDGPLLVFGQTALFFYLLHFPLLGGAAMATGRFGQGGLLDAYVAMSCVLAVLYPACRWFRSFKRARPGHWVRYI